MSFSLALGVFLVHLLGSIVSWKTTAIISIFFHLASLVMTLCSPESPSWLAFKGKYNESRKAFQWLRGEEENEELDKMIRAQMLNRNERETQKNTASQLQYAKCTVKKKEFYKPITIMTHACLLTIFSGSTIMAAYSTEILGLMMGPEANVSFWMVFLDTQRIVSNAVAVFVINRIRRRTVMFSVGTMSILSHLAISAYVMVAEVQHSKNIWLPALLVNLQIFAIAVGMVPVPEMLAGEIFPLEYKGIGGMVMMVVSSGYTFFVLKTFPGLLGAVGLGGAYIVYAGILTYSLVVNWFLLPETIGKTLQQIEDEFRGRPLASEEVEK